jgi:hypothetical protein
MYVPIKVGKLITCCKFKMPSLDTYKSKCKCRDQILGQEYLLAKGFLSLSGKHCKNLALVLPTMVLQLPIFVLVGQNYHSKKRAFSSWVTLFPPKAIFFQFVISLSQLLLGMLFAQHLAVE